MVIFRKAGMREGGLPLKFKLVSFYLFSIRMTAEVPEKSWQLSHYEMHRKAQPLMSSKEAPTTVSSKVSTKRFATQKPILLFPMCFSVYIQTSGARFAWTC